jgi:hypothetical protein
MRHVASLEEWYKLIDSNELAEGEVVYVTEKVADLITKYNLQGIEHLKRGIDKHYEEYKRFFSQKNPFKKNVLERANEIVQERGKSYGHPHDHFSRVAKLWSVLLGVPVTADQVVKCMLALKLDRLSETPHHQDSIDDIAGYAWCLDEVIQKMNKLDIVV